MKTSFWQTYRNFSHGAHMYLIVSALIGLTYFGFVSVLLNLYLLRLGYDTQFIGLANGSTSLAFAASSIPAGAIGGRIGYSRAVMWGILGLIVSVALLPLCEFLPPLWQETGIVVTRVMNGAGFAFYLVNAQPYLISATTSKDRDLVFALQVALPPTAGFVGNILAGLLPEFFAGWLGVSMDSPIPFRYPLYISAVLLVPALLAVWSAGELDSNDQPEGASRAGPNQAGPNRAASMGRALDKTAADKVSPEKRAAILRGPVPYVIIGCLALTALFRMAGEGAARSFFNVYLDTDLNISTARIGMLYAIGQIIAGPTALFAPALIRRLGKVPTAVLGTLGIAASMVLMGLVPHWAAVGAGFAGVIGMLSITRAVTNVYQMEIVAPQWRGLMSGVVSMAMGMGFSSMALGGGYIIPILGFRGLFLIGGAMVTMSALLFWLFFRVPRGEFARQSLLG